MQIYLSAFNFGESKLHNSNTHIISNHQQTLKQTKQLSKNNQY